MVFRLAEGRIYYDPTAIVGVNDSGDKQKALGLEAYDYMLADLNTRVLRSKIRPPVPNHSTAFDIGLDVPIPTMI